MSVLDEAVVVFAINTLRQRRHLANRIGVSYREDGQISFNISDFRAKALPKGGARPTLFFVDLTFPFTTSFSGNARFQIRAASIPSMPLERIRVPFMGRAIKLVGDRPDTPDWTVTIMNDEDFPLRVALEKWSNEMNALISNRMSADVWPTDYKGTAHVTQYGKKGDLLRAYIVEGIWPVNVDAMPLDWDAQNQLQSYDVTFSVDWISPDTNVPTNGDDYNPVMQDDASF